MTITKVEAGCGCLRQTITSGVLPPGETGQLTLEVNTLTQPNGPNRWQVVVGYKMETPNARPQTGELLLQITANLSREVSVSPPQLGFSTTAAASQILTVTDTRRTPLKVVKATASSPYLVAEVGTRVEGKGQPVTVKLAPDAPVGHRDEAVVLYTDDPAYPELRVPVRVLKRATQGVTVSPEAVSLRFAPGQSELSTLVQLRANGKTIELLGGESDLPGVVVKCSGGAGSIAVVRITVTESASIQSGSCKVKVKFKDPPEQEVVIAVAWTRAMK